MNQLSNTSRVINSTSHGSDSGLPATESLASSALRRISSDQLLGGQRELEITHGKESYRLRITASGKLILTK